MFTAGRIKTFDVLESNLIFFLMNILFMELGLPYENILQIFVMWKGKTRVTSCELRAEIYELRDQLHELQVQSASHEFKSTS